MWGAIFTLIVNIVSFILPILKANREVQESFFAFVEVAHKHKIASARLVSSIRAQRDKVRALWEAEPKVDPAAPEETFPKP